MKKIFVILSLIVALFAVVQSADAASPGHPMQKRAAFLANEKAEFVKELKNADTSLSVSPLASKLRASSIVEGPWPNLKDVSNYVCTNYGWFNDDYLNYTPITPGAIEPSDGTFTRRRFTGSYVADRNEHEVIINNFIDFGINVKGAFSEADVTCLTMKSGQSFTLGRTGEDGYIFVYDYEENHVVEDIIFYENNNTLSWESEFSEDAVSNVQASQRLIVANSMDMDADDYTEYMSLIFVDVNGINSVMSSGYLLPGRSDVLSIVNFVFAQLATAEDDSGSEASQKTIIRLGNLFSAVFASSLAWCETDFVVDLKNCTATATDIAVANKSLPGSEYWLWDGDFNTRTITFDIEYFETSDGTLVNRLTCPKLYISKADKDPNNTVECTDVVIQLPFTIPGLPAYSAEPVDIGYSFPVGSSVKIIPYLNTGDVAECSFVSNTPDNATIDSDGTVTFLAPGSANILCSDIYNCSGYYAALEAHAVEAGALQVFPAELHGNAGTEAYALAVFTPENTTYQDVEWSSTDTSVATVDADGRICIVGVGNTEIIASAQGFSAICSVVSGDYTGITAAGAGIAIDIVRGGIDVRGLPQYERILVSAIDGRVVNAALATESVTHIDLAPGLYIVKAGSVTAKVFVD